MMSKTQWTVLLMFFLLYLTLGASIFYYIESVQEAKQRDEEKRERMEIYELLKDHFMPDNQSAAEVILDMLSTYCGRNMSNYTDVDSMKPLKWDFYHSFFFAFTVVSTIGYGNLAPTTILSRILMMIYALIGIPINGILLTTLGEYFGTTFINAYHKWKKDKPYHQESWKLGLCGQIIIYLVPGFLFFIFIPALIIAFFEEWEYDVAVYYAFVTLTTIGFGDFVAGGQDDNSFVFMTYKLFLIIWIVFGLGYLVMVLGFITRGMRSKQMSRLEHKLAENIKGTQSRIWNGVVRDMSNLRKVLNEVSMLRFKPVYREFQYIPTYRERSQSCPDLSIYRVESPTFRRRRAFSECAQVLEQEIGRVQSDTDLERIDRNATFAANIVQPSELLARVVDALGNFRSETDLEDEDGFQGFSDEEILESERWQGSGWTIGGDKINSVGLPFHYHRQRTASEYKLPNFEKEKYRNNVDMTWSGPSATKKLQEIRRRNHKSFSFPRKAAGFSALATPAQGLLTRLKKPFMKAQKKTGPNTDNWKNKTCNLHQNDVAELSPEQYVDMTCEGRRSMFSALDRNYVTYNGGESRGSAFSVPGENAVLEETTIGDLIRAINSLHSRVGAMSNDTPGTPRRKMGTASLTPPKLPSLLTLFPPNVPPPARRSSLKPAPSGSRRMSLTPNSNTSRRRFSVRPVALSSYSTDPSRRNSTVNPPPYSSLQDNAERRINESSGERNTEIRRMSFRRASMAPSSRQATPRRFSLYPGSAYSSRQASRWRPGQLRNIPANTRHDDLTDVKIEKP